MNKIIFLVVSCLLLSLPLISACEAEFAYASHISLSSPVQYDIQADVTQATDPTSIDIHVKAGESVILSIPSSPTTGFSWHLHKASGAFSDIAESIELVSCEYHGRKRTRELFHTAGGSGHEKWSLVVKADSAIGAKSEIPLIYNRVWMPQPAQAKLTINIITAASTTTPADLYSAHSTTPTTPIVEPQPEEPKESTQVVTPVVDPIHPNDLHEPSQSASILSLDSSSSTPEEQQTPDISVDIDIDIEARRRRM